MFVIKSDDPSFISVTYIVEGENSSTSTHFIIWPPSNTKINKFTKVIPSKGGQTGCLQVW